MSGMIFEKAHVFYSPNKVIFGPNTVKGVGNEALQLGAKKPLIITDPGSFRPSSSSRSRPPLRRPKSHSRSTTG